MSRLRMPGWGAQRRWGFVVLASAAIALATLVTVATLDGLVYYRTPTELVREHRPGDVLRVGGLVVEDSIVRDDGVSTLVLTDGATDVDVRYAGALPAVVQEGEGAVVEGRWTGSGMIEATDVLMRHSNEYQPPQDEASR